MVTIKKDSNAMNVNVNIVLITREMRKQWMKIYNGYVRGITVNINVE